MFCRDVRGLTVRRHLRHPRQWEAGQLSRIALASPSQGPRYLEELWADTSSTLRGGSA